MSPSAAGHPDCGEPRQPGGCKLKTAPVRPVVAARPAE
ncbi:phosphohydrolase, partial [Klebsiella pneumoniae]